VWTRFNPKTTKRFCLNFQNQDATNIKDTFRLQKRDKMEILEENTQRSEEYLVRSF